MKAHLVRLFGVALFAVAFFLPAVKSPGTEPGAGTYNGWVCAVASLLATAGIAHLPDALGSKDAVGILALMLSGWVNLLVLAFWAFCFWPRWVRTRLGLAAAIAVCLAATWVFLHKAPMIPLVGHFVWVAGIATILAAEFLSGKAEQPIPVRPRLD